MRKDNVSVKNVKTINTQTGEVKQRRVETTTLDERPSIWNLQAFVIVFLFIMLATTINVYSVNNDNLTWVDSNGDFKVSSYDHSMINLDTDLIELNNQSLNDIFLDGNMISNHDFSDGLNNWIIVSSPTITLYDTYVEIYNSTGSGYARIEQRPNVSVGDKTYVTINAKSTGGDRLQYYNGSNLVLNASNEFQQLSGLSVAATQTDTYYQLGIIVSVDTLTILKGSIYAINVTDLGIDNLSKQELDDYYNLYMSLQENRIEAYKDLGNEPISQWQNLTQVLSDIMDAVAVPISDTIDWIDKFMFGLFS